MEEKKKKTKNGILTNYQIMLEKISNLSKSLNSTEISYLQLIASLYKDYPRHFIKMLKHNKKYSDIIKWIYSKTNFLIDSDSFIYSLSTRLNWIINEKDMQTNICANPTCTNHCGLKKQLRLNDEFPMHCSIKCSTTNPSTNEKTKKTKFKRYGNENYVNPEKAKATIATVVKENPNYWHDKELKAKQTKIANGHEPNWNNREKAIMTFNKHVEEDPSFIANKNAKCKATKLKHFGNENFVNIEKIKETRHKKYGKWENDEIKQKRAITCYKKYGVKTKIGLPEVREKIKNTCQKRYGVDNPLQSSKIRKKITNVVKEKYGVDHVWKNKEIQEKSKKTNFEKYGTFHGQSPQYMYDDIMFDSSWELALWIYCKDNNIEIQKNPCILKYQYNGKMHMYIVDFKIKDQLIEIKGDQFFKEDGTMQNPFDHSQDELYEAKHQCMLQNNVKILLYKDITKYIEYIEHKYGKNYFSSFKIQNIK